MALVSTNKVLKALSINLDRNEREVIESYEFWDPII